MRIGSSMGSYNTTIMPNKEPETELSREFDRQVGNLIQRGYPKAAGVTAEEFTKHIKPRRNRVRELPTRVIQAKEGSIRLSLSSRETWYPRIW